MWRFAGSRMAPAMSRSSRRARIPGGRDLRQPRSGDRREARAGFSGRLDRRPRNLRRFRVEDYAFSHDRSRLLVFTNTKRVWRANTRGDYWVLDRAGRELRKLGR